MKYLAAMAAMLAVTLMIPNSVNAGASASAPSKYAQANRAGQHASDRQSYPITEYSSSVRQKPKH